jgi:hypothetical protein
VLITWPDFDISPELTAVWGAGGDRGGGAGTERREDEEGDQS